MQRLIDAKSLNRAFSSRSPRSCDELLNQRGAGAGKCAPSRKQVRVALTESIPDPALDQIQHVCVDPILDALSRHAASISLVFRARDGHVRGVVDAVEIAEIVAAQPARNVEKLRRRVSRQSGLLDIRQWGSEIGFPGRIENLRKSELRIGTS